MARKIELVSDVANWHRWWSMRWIIVTVAISSIAPAYALLPSDWLPAMPDWLKAGFAYATLLTAALGGVARVIKQPATDCKTVDEPGEGK